MIPNVCRGVQAICPSRFRVAPGFTSVLDVAARVRGGDGKGLAPTSLGDLLPNDFPAFNRWIVFLKIAEYEASAF
jgi:hypothetical protein